MCLRELLFMSKAFVEFLQSGERMEACLSSILSLYVSFLTTRSERLTRVDCRLTRVQRCHGSTLAVACYACICRYCSDQVKIKIHIVPTFTSHHPRLWAAVVGVRWADLEWVNETQHIIYIYLSMTAENKLMQRALLLRMWRRKAASKVKEDRVSLPRASWKSKIWSCCEVDDNSEPEPLPQWS